MMQMQLKIVTVILTRFLNYAIPALIFRNDENSFPKSP